MADIEDEPLFALSEEDLVRLRADRDKINFTLTQFVSDEVRRECEAEMERGRKCGWRFN